MLKGVGVRALLTPKSLPGAVLIVGYKDGPLIISYVRTFGNI